MITLGSDKQWRVRLSVLEYTPDIANYLGSELFTRETESCTTSLFAKSIEWLGDPV
jgi:hypothetical protein